MRECGFVYDGCGGVHGRRLGKGEKKLDVVVLVLESGVRPGENGGESAVVSIWGVDGRVVEADKKGRLGRLCRVRFLLGA